MAIPHYVYLTLKMPTEQGVLSLGGNVYTTNSCEKVSFTIVEALDLSMHMQESVTESKKIPLKELEILSKEAASDLTKILHQSTRS
jgi:hypothetical protein